MLRKSSTAVFLGLVAAPGIVQAQLNPVPIIPTTEAPRTSVNGAVRVEESAGYKGTFQNTGMNFASAMKVKDGVIIRAKRMIKPEVLIILVLNLLTSGNLKIKMMMSIFLRKLVMTNIRLFMIISKKNTIFFQEV